MGQAVKKRSMSAAPRAEDLLLLERILSNRDARALANLSSSMAADVAHGSQRMAALFASSAASPEAMPTALQKRSTRVARSNRRVAFERSVEAATRMRRAGCACLSWCTASQVRSFFDGLHVVTSTDDPWYRHLGSSVYGSGLSLPLDLSTFGAFAFDLSAASHLRFDAW